MKGRKKSGGNAAVTAGPDHLFISYAWEDGALAEWLTLKLTAAGYRVWIDRFKLLGGESYPLDIDRANSARHVSNDRPSIAVLAE